MYKYVSNYIKMFHSNDYINLYFLGDFHISSLMHHKDLFMRIRDHIKKDKNAMILFLGDMFELDSTTIRQRRSIMYLDRGFNYKEEDIKYLDDIDKNVIPILDFITPENCIGMLDGNHYRRFSNGYTDLQYICMRKKLPYFGDGESNIFLKFNLGRNDTAKRIVALKVYHSHSNGISDSYDLSKLINKAKALEGFNIIAKAHTHKPLVIPFEKEVANQYTEEGYELKTVWLVNTSSTRKYRMIGETDYSEKVGYNPVSFKIPYITITMRITRKIKGYCDKNIFLEGKYLDL